VAIEGQGEKPALGDPEGLVEMLLECFRFALEAIRPSRVLPNRASQPRRSDLGVVSVAL
jgi:hypothetical protein